MMATFNLPMASEVPGLTVDHNVNVTEFGTQIVGATVSPSEAWDKLAPVISAKIGPHSAWVVAPEIRFGKDAHGNSGWIAYAQMCNAKHDI